ncbi:Clavaminate synthase-like protein [Pilatotrama ljubarskyi]|nr:Clavaminate synthase-like protein [Pilatotrama ljubarskyi]
MILLGARTFARRCLPHLLRRANSAHSRRLSVSTAVQSSAKSGSIKGAPCLRTRPVPEDPPALASSPHAFLKYIRSPTAAPFVLRDAHSRPASAADPRLQGRAEEDPGGGSGSGTLSRAAEGLLRTLRAAGDRLVEVEVGRYDRAADFGRVEVPLNVYLDWLTASPVEKGKEAAEMQLYLAQWRARDEVPGLAEVVSAPSLLAPLIEEGAVDLYQTSFFIGLSATVTPLHYDPYFNLYNVYASSEPSVHAKHFVLLPPTLSDCLSRADGSVLRNTSPVELHLLKGQSVENFDIAVDPSTPLRTTEALAESDSAMSCVLREGDTLFVPRRWWHRVENVKLQDVASSTASGWTAGVGWWFLPRNS